MFSSPILDASLKAVKTSLPVNVTKLSKLSLTTSGTDDKVWST